MSNTLKTQRAEREERKEGLAAPGKAREIYSSLNNLIERGHHPMIHIRSFFDLPPEAGRKGKAFSIANSTPNRVKVGGTIECLVPPWSLVRYSTPRLLLWPFSSRL
jgi:hypothetical protein